ncbi:MAG TPA: choice-of-anchor D domain-containing protein [Bacteroidales bacterium]|nr:choice-of-anchor D domain-containing protein [Bacteroidales bacterium]HQH25682.1 choice-of-anchor D domain-containing protein [Bacteroidales bacterium]HQK71171.1 choice-of-anchor D domain-containing protein [Bacteroidales bacterium]
MKSRLFLSERTIIKKTIFTVAILIYICELSIFAQVSGIKTIDTRGNDSGSKGIEIDIVDKSDSDVFPSMYVEPDGTAHLAYVKNNTLMYAKKGRQSEWVYKSLGSCIDCNQNDIVMDKTGNIQIVVQNSVWKNTYGVHGHFHVTVTPQGTYNKRSLFYAAANWGFHSMSLKVDSHNELHLVFQGSPGSAWPAPLFEMHTSGGKWTKPELIPSTIHAYDHVDMEVDSEDNLHISYYSTDIGFGYMKKDAGRPWSEPEVPEPGWSGAQLEGMVTSIITDDDLNPHISYVGQVNHDNRENIKYAWKKNGKWNISMVDQGEHRSAGNDIVLDKDGYPHFSYALIDKNEMRYATNKAGIWIKKVFDTSPGSLWPHTIDMGIDQDNHVHIAYPKESDPYKVAYALISPLGYFDVEPDILDFREVLPGATKTLTMQIINQTSQSLEIDSITLRDPRLSKDKNSFIINSNATGTVNITLNHTNRSWRDNLLSIWYGGLCADVPVQATSWQPVLTVDPSSVRFEDTPLNTTTTTKVKLTNTGNLDLIFSKIEEYKVLGSLEPDYFSLVGHNCSILRPGQFCEVELSFKPGKTGNHYSYLHIYSNDPVNPYKKISLSGTTAYPLISCDQSKINFGYCTVGQSVTKQLTVKNVGRLPLNITRATISGSSANQFTLENPCTILQPDESCVMQITMTPTSAADLTATLTIVSNSQYFSTYNVSLTGSTYLKNLEITPALIDFGEINTGAIFSRQIQLRNTGSGNINISGIELSGTDMYEFMPEHNCTIINEGATCNVTVWFFPLFPGSKTASLVVVSDDAYEPTQSVILQGTGGSALPLEATINADPGIGTAPMEVQFSAKITGGQPPFRYQWDFGDLTVSEEKAPVHTYDEPNLYNVSLQVEDVHGSKTSAGKPVFVRTGDDLIVRASATRVNGPVPLEVQLDAIITGGQQPFTYLWEFRDGTTSNIMNPVHIYNSPGSYWARITVTDTDADVGRDSVLITVRSPNSIAGQIWDETGTRPVIKSVTLLYPESDITHPLNLSLNGSNSYMFPNLSEANYTVRVLPDAVLYPGYLPTYLGNTLSMFEATWIQASGSITDKDIRLINIPPPNTGSYLISGQMIQTFDGKGLTVTFNKADLKGDPVAGALVYLKDSADGSLKAYDITAGDGSFEFGNLPAGSYYFIADWKGKPMDAGNIPLTVDASRNTVEILATVGTDNIKITDTPAGSEDVNLSGIKIYPVPAGDHLVIEIPEGLFLGNSIRLSIFDLSGKCVLVNDHFNLSSGPVTINIAGIPEGVYLMNLSDGKIVHRLKIIRMK